MIASNATHEAIETRSKITAFILKKYMLANTAGLKARMTSFIILGVDFLSRIWGPGDM